MSGTCIYFLVFVPAQVAVLPRMWGTGVIFYKMLMHQQTANNANSSSSTNVGASNIWSTWNLNCFTCRFWRAKKVKHDTVWECYPILKKSAWLPVGKKKKKKQKVTESYKGKNVDWITLWNVMPKLVLKNKPTLIVTWLNTNIHGQIFNIIYK